MRKLLLPLLGGACYLCGLGAQIWSRWYSPPKTRDEEWTAFLRSFDFYVVGFGIIIIHCLFFAERTEQGAWRRWVLLAVAFAAFLIGVVLALPRGEPQ